jgi:hypothetical protein
LIPAYLLLKPSLNGLLSLALIEGDEGIGWADAVWTDFGGHEARSVVGLEGALTSASDATLLGSVGEESSGLLIWEPF